MTESVPELAILASIVGRQSADLSVYADFLVTSLAGALPMEQVTVERERGRFGRVKDDAAVVAVTVRLGERGYGLRRSKPGSPVTPTVVHEVAGVVLSTRTVGLDEWSRAVAAGLAELADSNADAAQALSRLARFTV